MSERVAVITGSGAGLGKGIAQRLAKDGFKIVISDIHEDTAENTAKELQDEGYEATYFVGDVSKREDQFDLVAHAVDAYGRLDVFINNAGVEGIKPLAQVDEETFDKMVAINVKGVLWGIQAATEQMKKQNKDRIYKVINACSIAGHESYDLLGIYSMTKHAVRSLTQSAAKEYAEAGITVNAYCPGVAGTEMWDRIDAEMAKYNGNAPGETFEQFSSSILMGRSQEPEDVAGLVSYLASEDSDYMTGQAILIDGGMVMR
ncbi:diacetyl reductase [Aerococcus urinaehominis]|uniref:diacetyl reductase [(S)-acetoin forming] n=1 Tax=Aerococcus urinaehominis TaxID=128944 RepID=A0A0X8FK29_9LACT|nr:acetoin reductase [Aerococcus urinaehominis]AMB98744.1 diacetyl reductase [Aerococcus urinaehominis]SDM14394.1 meso-butanediol dehydrogenase / (S,S)-butanediol dehydrogenase / diacetyl reductase [Aerococcus urinaehominis]